MSRLLISLNSNIRRAFSLRFGSEGHFKHESDTLSSIFTPRSI